MRSTTVSLAVTQPTPTEVEMEQEKVPRYERNIRPLFRDKDVKSMSFALDLSAYADVRANADRIVAAVAGGTMPCDGRWPEERVALFRRWMDAGCPA
jgi:hypothetical protein